MDGIRRWAAVAAIGMVVVALCGCGTITRDATVRTSTEARAPKSAKAQAELPGSMELAAIAPGTSELMARVRATDACSLLNREFAERLGPFQRFDRSPGWERGTGWTGCGLLVTEPENPDTYYSFNLELDKLYTSDKRSSDKPEQINGRTVYRSANSDDGRPDAYSCEYRIPAGDTGFGHFLTIAKMAGAKKTPVPWSQPCRFTKDYLAATIDGVSALPPHVIDHPVGRSLMQRNPCAAEQQISAQFRGWQMSSVGWTKAYKCAITLIQPGGGHRVTIEVSFEQNIEQMVKTGEVLRLPSGLDGGQSIQYGRHTTVEGLTGIEIRSVQSTDPTRQNTTCKVTLNYRRADPPTANNAHLLHVSLNLAPATPPFPFDACTQVTQITPTVLRAIP
ncbi:DUF3558 domain-containing protein [Nocardia iowensis]|uniref:DUF3558 domain-containing protein n=1 Tax=Nocardia iowensis TaxID=204891 RepID=A0ABX8RX40_NOCIO|nr:DUF3558 domain-containing protein [Nocardia iowensis]QXN93409.1 DUF3558 domain-containing protein [Nocardia iowensis]